MAVRRRKTKAVAAFGDFQTPPALALAAARLLSRLNTRPRSILEPTCGQGAFVAAAAACFPDAGIIGVDINPRHLQKAKLTSGSGHSIEFRQGNFFTLDWSAVVTEGAGPWLILGNPPWVTSSDLSAIDSDNLPKKSNFHGRAGIEAITGKSNFDISEWMLLRYLDWLQGQRGTIAVLCKTAVARKILLTMWKRHYPFRAARIYKIDALAHFRAAVDACFFVVEVEPDAQALSCEIFASLEATAACESIGFSDGHLISDFAAFTRRRHLLGPERAYVWRSGVKHDCSKVMELVATERGYRNGIGEIVSLEDTLLFPMLKSSDIGNGRAAHRGVMLVTQQLVGQDTAYIKSVAPKTWQYLNAHSGLLAKRGSIIYKNKPAFCVFGVGPYTFAPWKIAISGFYKKLHFTRVGPVSGRSVVFDDTIYFLPCWSEDEANFLDTVLNSDAAREFYASMIHWDDKRPITVDLLKRLSIDRLAAELGREGDYNRFLDAKDKLPLLGIAAA